MVEIESYNSSYALGFAYEDTVRKAFISNRLEKGEALLVHDSGLMLYDRISFFGASSDGHVTCKSVDLNCVGFVEIKCPFSIDKASAINFPSAEIAQKFGKKFFLKMGENGELSLHKGHVFYAQVDRETAVLNVDWLDLVVFRGWGLGWVGVVHVE